MAILGGITLSTESTLQEKINSNHLIYFGALRCPRRALERFFFGTAIHHPLSQSCSAAPGEKAPPPATSAPSAAECAAGSVPSASCQDNARGRRRLTAQCRRQDNACASRGGGGRAGAYIPASAICGCAGACNRRKVETMPRNAWTCAAKGPARTQQRIASDPITALASAVYTGAQT